MAEREPTATANPAAAGAAKPAPIAPVTEAQPTLQGSRVVLRPAEGPDELLRLAEAITSDPETSPWWTTDSETVFGWLIDEESTVFIIDVEGELAGLIQYEEQDDPYYRFAGIDISLLSPFIGRGLGADALRTLARYLFDVRGHHRLQIDPAAINDRAIAAYKRVGFKPVGVMRSYERSATGEWRDGLLMDMLRDDLTED